MKEIYVNKLINEDDGVYTYTITTKNNCENLIKNIIDTYYNMGCYDTVAEFLEEEGHSVDKRVLEYIENHNIESRTELEGDGVITFIEQILNYYKLTIECGACEIYY